ncbi:MAG: putative quinol monooxygenase [Pacificimonas sp.]
MIVVLGYMKLDSAAIDDDLKAAMQTVMTTTRGETGCHRYSLALEDEAAGTVSISELWADADALKAHGAQPHMAAFGAALKGKVRAMDLKMYDADNERAL